MNVKDAPDFAKVYYKGMIETLGERAIYCKVMQSVVNRDPLKPCGTKETD